MKKNNVVEDNKPFQALIAAIIAIIAGMYIIHVEYQRKSNDIK